MCAKPSRNDRRRATNKKANTLPLTPPQGPSKEEKSCRDQSLSYEGKQRKLIEAINNVAKTSTWEKLAFFINVFLTFGTFGAVFYSARQVALSRESIEISKESIEITRRQFEAETLPIIQFKDVVLTYRKEDPFIAVKRLIINNLRDYPVKVKNTKIDFVVRRLNKGLPNYDSLLTHKPSKDSVPSTFGVYLTKESPIDGRDLQLDFTSTSYERQIVYEETKAGIRGFYFFGRVFYVNLADNTNWRYTFCLRISDPWNCATSICTYQIIANENEEDKTE